MSRLPYPPPFMDIATLCAHLCISPTTADVWVKRGLLPAPKLRGGKRLWRWSEVEKCLGEDEVSICPEAGRIRDATRQALAEKD